VEYSDWAPQYDRIRTEFGFDLKQEAVAARLLESLLPASARVDPLARVRARLEGHDAIVVGRAPNAGPPPLWRRPTGGATLIAADGATVPCLDAGLVPTMIVTDLDGPVASEVAANRRGSLVVVHAHGDNQPAVREWVPQFPGELAGSWSGPPRGPLLDVGGFTDGDRAAFLADHAGASRVILWGFDFDRVETTPPAARARKLAKLAWARRVLGLLARHGRAPLVVWRPDGSEVPYDPGNAVESTR
jgi:2-amino-4-hydroxy-6-hydroxymethyldihydropteridine diphosphokinase